MWFGNFKHNVYQLASFCVWLRLGKEETQQMRVKVWRFRSLCPVGLYQQNGSLNTPKSGVRTFCCSPRRRGKWDCGKSSFAMKRGMPNHSHLCSWRQVSPVGVRPSRSKLLPPQTHFIVGSFFPWQYLFLPLSIFVGVWGNVSVHIWAGIPPMDSTRLFSLCPCDASLLHIFLQQRNNLSQALQLGIAWLGHHVGTAHPKAGPMIFRKVPTQFSPIKMQKFSFIPPRLEVSIA